MKKIKTKELIPGFVLAEDVFNYNGQLILTKGTVLTDKAITRLEFYSILSVRVEDEIKENFVEELPQGDFDQMPHSEIIRQSPEFNEFKGTFDDTLSDFKSSINNIVELNSPINTEELLSNTKSLIEQAKHSSFSAMDMLHNMRQYDDLTFAHSMNVSLICNVFGGWLKMKPEEIDLLTLCGMLHDLGKLKIPDSIIKKPDKLTTDEYQLVKTHTVEGYHILKAQGVNTHISNSALMHHERCDGSGYPLGLTSDRIDEYAKIVGIVDVYDAMTSARIYRGPMCPFRVIELYESEGLQKYDAHYILTFLENVSNTYLHYNVLLSDGRIGKIVFINKNALSKPIVQCMDEMVDLSKHKDLHVEKIL
ncbi:MAG: HD-GYP domain-containing protein [Lachnospiraceae bacterium]|nr:HD-GYP domain-containing protein [Lachnospiraceae bacterium]